MRVAAKELTSLILDEDRLRNERSDRKLWKSRISNIDDGVQGIAGGEPPRRPDRRERRNRPNDEEDAEYRLAIEASKHEAEEEKRRRENAAGDAEDDDDLAKAIRLSKEEEELRKRELEESNAASLFDDTPVQPAPAQPTGFNQGYQQQGAVDWFGNPVDQQQPMSTGFLNNQYSQPTGFPQQPTGYVNGFQPTGFDQSQFQPQPQQQQQNNFLQPQTTLQPQQTSFNNPYANDIFSQQQQQQPQQQQPQQESFPQAGSHNPWANPNQQSQESLKPAPTGSNNPFARNQFQPQKQQNGPPSLSTLAEQKTATQFNQSNTQMPSSNPIANFQAPRQPASTPPESQLQQQHAHLNTLLASGDGQDTFGNTGDLRIPSQHTAPGTFVNSAGQGVDRIHASHTGNNPFFTQQFTGAPSQHPGLGRPSTGQPNNNPFGGQQQPVYAQQQQQQQGGSLIDL